MGARWLGLHAPAQHHACQNPEEFGLGVAHCTLQEARRATAGTHVASESQCGLLWHGQSRSTIAAAPAEPKPKQPSKGALLEMGVAFDEQVRGAPTEMRLSSSQYEEGPLLRSTGAPFVTKNQVLLPHSPLAHDSKTD